MTGAGDLYAPARQRMVDEQLRVRGIADERVLAAMGRVRRELFVAPGYEGQAYVDGPLPIGDGQTISQPYVVARTAELLAIEPGDRVLDVGVGSGYQTAVFAELTDGVFGVEIRPDLLERARGALDRAGYGQRAQVRVSDGHHGWPEHGPYQAIALSAAAPGVPPSLFDQLADGGRLVVPEGNRMSQELVRYRRRGDEFLRETFGLVRFVPFVGGFGPASGR